MQKDFHAIRQNKKEMFKGREGRDGDNNKNTLPRAKESADATLSCLSSSTARTVISTGINEWKGNTENRSNTNDIKGGVLQYVYQTMARDKIALSLLTSQILSYTFLSCNSVRGYSPSQLSCERNLNPQHQHTVSLLIIYNRTDSEQRSQDKNNNCDRQTFVDLRLTIMIDIHQQTTILRSQSLSPPW